MADLKSSDVGAYLKRNPDFARKWFLENVGSDTLKEWLTSGSGTPGEPPPVLPLIERFSLTSSTFQDIVNKRRNAKKTKRRTKSELLNMNPLDLFMELIKDVANELDVDLLCYKILLNVKILTHSDRGSLFLAQGYGQKRYLVSKLFDVNEDSSIDDCLHTEDTQIRVPFGKGIAGAVALSKKPINIKDVYEDPRFNKEVDKMTGYRTRNLLCMPILNYEGELVGVAQIINKTNGEAEFTERDEEVFRNYLTFCGIGLTNAQLFEMSVMEYRRNQLLLGLARGIFTEQSNMDNLVRKIMLDAQDLLKCQRCCVYLIDNTLKEDPFTQLMNKKRKSNKRQEDENHMLQTAKRTSPSLASLRGASDPGSRTNLKPEEIVFYNAFELHGDNRDFITPSSDVLQRSKSAQIAREVGSSGKVKNISDALVDPTLGQETSHQQTVDEIIDYDGFKIRSLLSLPIRNSDNHVIGVVQLMNKINGRPFTEVDIHIVEAFAIFCGLGVHNCQMYESACKLMAKQSVALEVLSYHATAAQEDVDKIKNAVIPSTQQYRLCQYDFNDFPLNEDETVKATIRMFMDMDVVNKFQIPYEVLCRWTLSVKKNYRPVIYHNWRHAFNVAQTMFTMLNTGNMSKYMDTLEMFSLIVACLCHDLDHRGTNNAFQSKTDSPLATLYSTSTMEHHHFDQCIMILNSEGNNIFMRLSAEDYKRMISVLESAILSTDLALYFKKRGGFESLVKTGERSWVEPEKRDLLRGMMMTACDVAAITKPWEIQKEVAQLVASEFFEQGDLERDRLHEEPIAMMDRQKKEELPKMQVGFIDAICLPVYKMLTSVEENLSPLHKGCLNNRTEWQNLADERQQEAAETNDNNKKNKTDQTKESTPSPKNEVPPPQPRKRQSLTNPDTPTSSVVADKNTKNSSVNNSNRKQSQAAIDENNSMMNNGSEYPAEKSKTCTLL